VTSAARRPHVPDVLRRNAVQVWGRQGRAWLDALPDHLDACVRRWSLEVGEPFVLSFHWVAPARTAQGAPVVLKLGVPGQPHLRREAAVLRAWGGRGAVRLLDDDPTHGALLLERADPGTTLADAGVDDEAATLALAEVARALHRADVAGLDLPDIASEQASFEDHARRHGDRDPLPPGAVERARDLLLDLTRSRERAVLLHGDLHHSNVLRDGGDGRWVAIDPHGWVGDPGFEVGPLLHNPVGATPEQLVRWLPRRLEVLADLLDEPLDRVRAWGFVATVLSQVWSCEDGGAPEPGAGAVVDALLPR
jgi:streptomycin 6-kinase